MNYFKISKFLLFLIPLGVVLVTRTTLFPFIVGKYVWFRALVDCSVIFFAIGFLSPRLKGERNCYGERLKKVARSPITIAAALFTVAFVVSGFLGFNPSYSFWSNFERGEGSIQIIHLFLFFALMSVLFREKRDWLNMFRVMVVGALLMIAYGVGAGLQWPGFVGPSFHDPSFRFVGSIGNPAYVAAYLIFSTFAALYLWLEKYRTRPTSEGSVILLGSVAVFSLFFLLAATRGAFVGLMAGTVVVLGYLALMRRKWRGKLMFAGIIFVVVLALLVAFRNSAFVRNLPGSRIFDISFYTTTFQHRMIMWDIAWRSFKERPILGWGPESFGYLFQKNFNPAYYVPGQGFGAWFDRAHSIVFDYLAETGILGLASYLSIFVASYVQFFRKRSDIEKSQSVIQSAIVVSVPIMYLVQGLALFDVLVIYINVFILFGFMQYLSADKAGRELRMEKQQAQKNEPSNALKSLPAMAVVLALLSIYFGSYLPIAKSRRYLWARGAITEVRSVKDFKAIFDKVLSFRAPVSDIEIIKFLGGDMVSTVSQKEQPEAVSRELIEYVEKYSRKEDVLHLLNLAFMHQALFQRLGKEEDLEKAVTYFEKAHRIAPQLPQSLYGLFDLYRTWKKYDNALEVGRKIVDLWPDQNVQKRIEEISGESATSS